MKTKAEIITKKGNTLRLEGISALQTAGATNLLEREKRLNRQQRKTIIGWLGKGRVQTLVEGIQKIEARIRQDSMQGKKSEPISRYRSQI